MKIIILKENLKNGLNIIERTIGKRLTLPILSNVLLKAEKNFLILSSTNLEIASIYWILTKIEKEGTITIPLKAFLDYISFLPNNKIILEKTNNSLIIQCGSYKAKIKGEKSEEFPILPKIETEDFIKINCNSFCQGISQVVDFTTLSQTRPELSGVYFNFQKNLLKIAATDSFRLAEKTIFLETSLDKEYSFILPQITSKEIINLFSEKKESLKIFLSPNQILFEVPMAETSHPQLRFISRLIEGEYPGYQEIIPKKWETKLILPREEFLNQIRISGLFSGRINEVKIKVFPKEGKIEIFSQNPELGENKSELFGKIEGKEVEVSFNFKFILEGLTHIKTKEVVFELNGLEGPAILKPLGDESYLYVVMPIKAS